MTVGELIEFLSGYPVDMPILISADEEGNSFSLLSDVDDGLYDPTYPYYIDRVYLTHAELDECLASSLNLGYTEEDRAPAQAIPAVVLWP